MIYPQACAGHRVIDPKPCPSRGRLAYKFTAADGTVEILSLCLKHDQKLHSSLGMWYIPAPKSGSNWVDLELLAERPGSYESRSQKWHPVEVVV